MEQWLVFIKRYHGSSSQMLGKQSYGKMVWSKFGTKRSDLPIQHNFEKEKLKSLFNA